MSTNAHIISIKLILILLQDVAVFLHHPQSFCLIILRIIEMIRYNKAAFRYGKMLQHV
jgi:hypothetical protein